MSGNGLTGRFRVLVVGDEKDLVDLLACLVGQAGLIPLSATEPQGALELFEKEHPSLAVVDLNLRPWDGFELLAELRRRSPKMPILVLTARGAEDDKVRALDLGADDYVVKPFGHRELQARIRAHARRAKTERTDDARTALEVGSLKLDPEHRTLQSNDVSTRLTR